jgi:hypothetical protein
VSRRKPIDLARERRIRTNLAKLKEMLAKDQELARRTHAALAGRIPAPDLEEPTMTNEEQVSIRVPRGFLERVEKLARRLAKDPRHSTAYRVTRASTLRLALLRGVEALEAEQAAKQQQK